MLFDLRSRRRKNTVRVVYSLLAAVMVVGLVAFGIGTGTSGLFGSGNSSSSSSNSSDGSNLISKAEAKVKKDPSSASAWANLFNAHYVDATSGSNINSSTGALTTTGVAAMKAAVPAWEKYVKLSGDKPLFQDATNAGHMYVDLALYDSKTEWVNAVSAWEYAVQALRSTDYSSLVDQYTCLTLSAYAGGQTTTADAAATKTEQVSKAAKLAKTAITEDKAIFKAAKSSTKEAEEYAADSCSTLSVS